jgi:pilus assembly protein Flp/PilA
MKLFKNFIREEEGQDLVEYALLLALLALAAILALKQLGSAINTVFVSAQNQLQGS